jgi:hypothetical protein
MFVGYIPSSFKSFDYVFFQIVCGLVFSIVGTGFTIGIFICASVSIAHDNDRWRYSHLNPKHPSYGVPYNYNMGYYSTSVAASEVRKNSGP